jgi:hypothetical protein
VPVFFVLAACQPIPEPQEQEPVYDIPVVRTTDNALSPYTEFSGEPVLKITDAHYDPDDGAYGAYGAYGAMKLPNFTRHSLFLVKVNHSGRTVDALSTGWAELYYIVPGRSTAPRTAQAGPIAAGLPSVFSDGNQILKDLPETMKFNSSLSPVSGSRRTREMQAVPVYNLGDTRDFWVQDQNDEWIQLPAVLRAESTRTKVWIADSSYAGSAAPGSGLVDTAQAQTLAAKFDQIYGHATAIFGSEPGGSGSASPGGIDGDQKVHILVYDIKFDRGTSGATAAGFFWAKDLFTQAELDYLSNPPKTNLAEMFYLDADITGTNPDFIYLTMIHEFQHMICYNEKQLVRRLTVTNNYWYLEMLAMLAEDLIAPKIGIGTGHPGHPASNRMPEYLIHYPFMSVNGWDDKIPLASYSNAYAFGAYLVRNYGGAALLKEIALNNYMDDASINAALASAANPVSGVSNIQAALGRYGEALVYGNSPYTSNRISFNRTNETLAGYPFSGFNIWLETYVVSNIANFPPGYRGPLVININYAYDMRPNSLMVQSRLDWQGITTRDAILVIHRPKDPDVDLYLMVR